MDIIKLDLEPLAFRPRLDEAEGKAITTRTRKISGALRSWSALVAGMGGLTLVMLPFMALVFLVMPHSIPLGILAALAMFLSCLAVGMYGFTRYLDPADRKLLPTLLEPQAKAFFLAHADRRELLLDRSEAFDEALRAFKALPERADADEVDAGVVENLSERRAALETEIAAYLAEFEKATADDRFRVAGMEELRGKPKSADKRALAAFRGKLWKLRHLEDALDGLKDSIGKGMTVDLSPFVAAQRFRRELEEERAGLVARGLKPKKLPKPRVAAPKLLPSAT